VKKKTNYKYSFPHKSVRSTLLLTKRDKEMNKVAVELIKQYNPEQSTESVEEIAQDLEKEIKLLVRVPISNNKYAALISFTYENGLQALKASQLLYKLNQNDIAGAGAEFLKWNKKIINGELIESNELFRQRDIERSVFLS
jgi:GH24 family phage-related lysozyme (muramidase)